MFVPTGSVADATAQVEPREVSVGLMNETHAQVTEGIEPGQAVVLLEVGQGRDLLERAGIEVEPPRQQRNRRGRPEDADGAADSTDAAADAGDDVDDDAGDDAGETADESTSAASDAGTVPVEPTPAKPAA